MPSMASTILNASRGSAASRCAAAVPRSGFLVVAAASDPLRSSFSFDRSGSNAAAPPHFNIPGPAPGKVEFVAEEKDLESDEAIWALYERWCKAFNQERSHDEMTCRFHRFKQTVLSVDSTNKACLPYRLEINRFADGKNITLVRPKVPVGSDRVRKKMGYSDSGTTFRGAAGEFKKEPQGPGEFEKEP